MLVTIYKEEGDRSLCGNYIGISLFSTAGKISKVVLQESQSGFSRNRSTFKTAPRESS